MTREEFFQVVAKDTTAAVSFLSAISDIAHTWDDLIDRDVPVSDAAINRAFMLALLALPNNSFYSAHFAQLNPLLLSAINNWFVANELEKLDTDEAKRIAFITRSSYADLITCVAFIVGGQEWVLDVGPKIRLFVHSEGWQGYQENLATERIVRSQLTGE